jgi:adenosine kinase
VDDPVTGTAPLRQVAVTGSIATDHLMHFPGRFTESLLPDQLHRVSLSFLVDDLQVRRGGVAANICFAMGVLGQRPILLDAVGTDFGPYEVWLTDHGVNTEHVLRCSDVATARFVCTTDEEMNQIGSFYAGAMSRAREIDIVPTVREAGGVDLVMISAGDPDAMLRHAQACRDNGFAFAADPSQQLARIDGTQARQLLAGAELLFSNDYELGLLKSKTGWSDEDILEQVGHRITTHGAHGVEIVARDGSSVTVSALPEHGKVDPTGVGDAFRGGFLAGRCAGLAMRQCAELGSLMATLALETMGTQEYTLAPAEARERLAGCYGAGAAAEIGAALGW